MAIHETTYLGTLHNALNTEAWLLTLIQHRVTVGDAVPTLAGSGQLYWEVLDGNVAH